MSPVRASRQRGIGLGAVASRVENSLNSWTVALRYVWSSMRVTRGRARKDEPGGETTGSAADHEDVGVHGANRFIGASA